MSFISKIKTLAGESVIYGLSGIISRLISFFLLPFFARTLSTNDYGAIALLQSFFFLFNAISILSLDTAVFRWFYDSDDNKYHKTLFSTTISFQLVWTVVLGGAMWLIGILFLAPNLQGYPVNLLMLLLFINLLGSFMPVMYACWCRLKHRPWAAVLFGITNTVISFGASFLFVIVYKFGVTGFLAGQTIALTVTSLVAFAVLKDWIKPSLFDFSLLKKLASYGIKFLPANFATVSMLFLINLIVQNMTSQSNLGLYQMGVNFALIITLITTAFSQAWSPFSFSIMKDPNNGEIYNLAFQLYVALISTGALFLALFSKELLIIIASEKFADSAIVAGFVTFAYAINSLSTIAMTGMTLTKDMKWYSPVVVATCGSILILMIILIPYYGKEGAALAFLLGYSISPFLLFYKSQKIYKIPFQFFRPLIVIMFSFAIFLFAKKLFFDGMSLDLWFWKIGLFILYLAVIFVLYYSFFRKFIKIVLPKPGLIKSENH